MRITSNSPGRICLFGEHQDYMALSVISAAINLTINITGTVSAGDYISVSLPDIGKSVKFDQKNIVYEGGKDYVRSVVKVLKERGLLGEVQVEAVLKGNIPRRAGTSSSSALSVAWAGFLLASRFSPDEINSMKKQIAEAAYWAEVEEFGESGGRQDQYASAFGGVNYFTFFNDITVESLDPHLGGFVLGDSKQEKNTQKTLRRIRDGQESGLKELSEFYKFKSNRDIEFEKASEYFSRISSGVRPYLEAVLENNVITEKARLELLKTPLNNYEIASLMNRHHSILRDKLDISTERIEEMINGSLEAGALSAKINGSGEGGCMFAYCPGKEQEVSDAILKAGGTPHIISIGKGLEVSTSI
ncbi:MAG: GHMP kinase [Candidatus Aminicenantes bacterium]|nr:GHMP kinase [Candidatus Aminicenantes bacterium]